MKAADAVGWTPDGGARKAAIRAPAKLNLGLRVVGRRADGYHLLESVFVPLDLADDLTLRLEPAPRMAVRLDLEGAPPDLEIDDRNLAVRAARAFLAEAGLAIEARVALRKRIPVGAGLGGGSSDAGAVLRALAAGHPGAVAPPRLAALAVSLGADVPYFLDPRPAWVRGIGDVIEPIGGLPALPVLVATPRPPLATAGVFRAWDAHPPAEDASRSAALTPAEPGRSMPPPFELPDEVQNRLRGRLLRAQVLRGQLRGRVPERICGAERTRETARRLVPNPADAGLSWQALLANDLEAVASRLHPGVARLRTEIERAGARAVGMSGSGPTVFGVFGDAEEAQAAATRIPWEPTDHVHVGTTTGSP